MIKLGHQGLHEFPGSTHQVAFERQSKLPHAESSRSIPMDDHYMLTFKELHCVV